jgi:hypothetical protein
MRPIFFKGVTMSSRQLLRSASTFFASLLLCTTVHAVGLFRAYLSAGGSDANPCTLELPCRLLPAALNAVASRGEIWMVDSANYGSNVTVGKSVSILAVPGAAGSVVAKAGGPAITIAANGLQVALRNLVIVSSADATSGNGIHMTGASALTIENCLIANLLGHGVVVSGTGRLRIANTILRNNTAWAVLLANGATAEISGTQMLTNYFGGVNAYGGVASITTATVSDSVISNGGSGVSSYGGSGVSSYSDVPEASARINVTRSTINGTDYALYTHNDADFPSAVITVSYSMIVNNSHAWNQSGGAMILSLGNNHIRDNFGGSTGVLTQVALQ